ncbi:morphogenetic protein associated with SpoVID [Scopulibacillus daqui]|uniref:Morphogenetic protein associated with SpoVID n=1 Tax=Scopulibacillus daqui TaxID=1469162 RepID=A0ABS2PXX3_9BACL|nr:morphogenetic protein associated with SpoVID [Scopulibacillus daqui]
MKIYVVQKGDTLYKIAQQHGIPLEELKKMNSQLSNPDKIMPGMKVKVPTGYKPVKKKEEPMKKEMPIKKEEQKAKKEEPIYHGKKEMPKAEHPVVYKQSKKTAPIYPIIDNKKEENWNLDVNPNVNPNINHNADAHVNPNVNPNINPNAGTHVNPNVNPNINPNAGTHVNPNVNPNINPNAGAHANPNVNTKINPEAKTDQEDIQYINEPNVKSKPNDNIHEIPMMDNELPNIIHPKNDSDMMDVHPSMNSMPFWEWDSKMNINEKKPVLNKPLENPWDVLKEKTFDDSNDWENPYMSNTSWHGAHFVPDKHIFDETNVNPEANVWHDHVNPEANIWHAHVNPEAETWDGATGMSGANVWHDHVNPENPWPGTHIPPEANVWPGNVNPAINPWHHANINPETNHWYGANIKHETAYYPSSSHLNPYYQHVMNVGYWEPVYYGQQMPNPSVYPNQEYYGYQNLPLQGDCGCQEQPNMYYQPAMHYPGTHYYDQAVQPAPSTPPTPPTPPVNREESNNQRWDSYANYQEPPYLPQFPTLNKKDE